MSASQSSSGKKRPLFYSLNEDLEVEPCDENFETKVLQQEYVGEAFLSTIFLGLDHNFHEEGPPILFETMIFGGPQDGEQVRSTTYVKAMSHHYRLKEELLCTRSNQET